jgi:hypothetical protein
MDNYTIYFSLIINALITTALAIRYRKFVINTELTEIKAKRRFSWLCFATSLTCGLVLHSILLMIFKVHLGHGEIIFAGPMFNLLLCPALIFYGRVIIGWEPMSW